MRNCYLLVYIVPEGVGVLLVREKVAGTVPALYRSLRLCRLLLLLLLSLHGEGEGGAEGGEVLAGEGGEAVAGEGGEVVAGWQAGGGRQQLSAYLKNKHNIKDNYFNSPFH